MIYKFTINLDKLESVKKEDSKNIVLKEILLKKEINKYIEEINDDMVLKK